MSPGEYRRATQRWRWTNSEKPGFDFLKTELETGLTFADIALKAKWRDKIKRNTVNARKAYDSALKFLNKVPLRRQEREQLSDMFHQLRDRLIELGEAL